MKSIGIVFVYVVAGMFFIASILEMGHETLVPHSFEGFRNGLTFLIAYFTAGGNMVPNMGYQQAAEAWSITKVQ